MTDLLPNLAILYTTSTKFAIFSAVVWQKLRFFLPAIDEICNFIPWLFTKLVIFFCNCSTKFTIFFLPTYWQDSRFYPRLIEEIRCHLSQAFDEIRNIVLHLFDKIRCFLFDLLMKFMILSTIDWLNLQFLHVTWQNSWFFQWLFDEILNSIPRSFDKIYNFILWLFDEIFDIFFSLTNWWNLWFFSWSINKIRDSNPQTID